MAILASYEIHDHNNLKSRHRLHDHIANFSSLVDMFSTLSIPAKVFKDARCDSVFNITKTHNKDEKSRQTGTNQADAPKPEFDLTPCCANPHI